MHQSKDVSMSSSLSGCNLDDPNEGFFHEDKIELGKSTADYLEGTLEVAFSKEQMLQILEHPFGGQGLQPSKVKKEEDILI